MMTIREPIGFTLSHRGRMGYTDKLVHHVRDPK
jgi:hypothetical protein